MLLATLVAVLGTTPTPAARAAPALDPILAERFTRLALACVHQEYPNKIAHVMNADADARPPRDRRVGVEPRDPGQQQGIERHDQLAWLAGCGPVHVQGYLIARPMPATEVLGFAGRSAQLLEQLLSAAAPHAGGRRTGNPVVPFRQGPGSADR